jgi:hypothetical protein
VRVSDVVVYVQAEQLYSCSGAQRHGSMSLPVCRAETVLTSMYKPSVCNGSNSPKDPQTLQASIEARGKAKKKQRISSIRKNKKQA